MKILALSIALSVCFLFAGFAPATAGKNLKKATFVNRH